MNTNISDLREEVGNLYYMYEEIKDSIHSAIIQGRKFERYYPSYFLYSFFFYNTMFNYDWKESFIAGRLILSMDNNEKKRSHRLIDFCFQDDTFIKTRKYRDIFTSEVLQNYHNIHEIYEILEGIKSDREFNKYSKSKIDTELIKNFNNIINSIFIDKKFCKEYLYTLVDFIYLVRCNIVHGSKSLSDMNKDDQKDRLLFYKDILMAVNKMVLDYAKHLLSINKEEFEEEEKL